MKNEINGELVLIPESKLKDFGPKGTKWKKWEGGGPVDIYYSPSSIEFGDDPYPEISYLVYDNDRKEVVHVGYFLDGFNENMSEHYDDKLYEESMCMENFIDYLIKTYGRKTKN